jgi:hypothetical protein
VDDDDFRALIEVLTQEFEGMGEGDLADERHYIDVGALEAAADDAQLLEPREHLIAMLEAFLRFLAVQDRATYDRAMADLNQRLSDAGPRLAIVESPEANPVRLSDAPDLGSVRIEVMKLIYAIRDSGDERPRSGS